jgi:hypothetical protein
MRNIAEMSVLLRVRAELPKGMKLTTEEFREGWSFVRSADAVQLRKKIQTRGWNFIKIADGALRSGVGDTSEEAIANALKLALRRIGTDFNAAEVERIELAQYPWFFLARVLVHPYRIQQGALLPMPDEAMPLPIAPRQRRLPPRAAEPFPHFGSAVPMLKEMLILSRSSQARPE